MEATIESLRFNTKHENLNPKPLDPLGALRFWAEKTLELR